MSKKLKPHQNNQVTPKKCEAIVQTDLYDFEETDDEFFAEQVLLEYENNLKAKYDDNYLLARKACESVVVKARDAIKIIDEADHFIDSDWKTVNDQDFKSYSDKSSDDQL